VTRAARERAERKTGRERPRAATGRGGLLPGRACLPV
jgi:hypothetical protein